MNNRTKSWKQERSLQCEIEMHVRRARFTIWHFCKVPGAHASKCFRSFFDQKKFDFHQKLKQNDQILKQKLKQNDQIFMWKLEVPSALCLMNPVLRTSRIVSLTDILNKFRWQIASFTNAYFIFQFVFFFFLFFFFFLYKMTTLRLIRYLNLH